MSLIDFCWCRRGIICATHPRQPWPHANCAAGGARCTRLECAYGREQLRRGIERWRHEAKRAEGTVPSREDVPPQELLARADLVEGLLLAWERDHTAILREPAP